MYNNYLIVNILFSVYNCLLKTINMYKFVISILFLDKYFVVMRCRKLILIFTVPLKLLFSSGEKI